MREPIRVRLAVALDRNGSVVACGTDTDRMTATDAEGYIKAHDVADVFDLVEPTYFFADVLVLPGPGTRKAS